MTLFEQQTSLVSFSVWVVLHLRAFVYAPVGERPEDVHVFSEHILRPFQEEVDNSIVGFLRGIFALSLQIDVFLAEEVLV